MSKENVYKSTRARSLVKSITFRISATILTMILVFAFSEKTSLALKIGVADFISKIVLYYFHERIWNIISWGK
ncbi:hypothetical protein DRN58_01595 [Thermococci archaeon]|nr:MAG: hypothetical protein DRN50_05110 [Thermococci archaeon]RLG01541.1 MAG: hypothetical protein DRN58_01595 [Thermococci archaeon]